MLGARYIMPLQTTCIREEALLPEQVAIALDISSIQRQIIFIALTRVETLFPSFCAAALTGKRSHPL